MEEDKKLKKKKITIIFSILFMVIILLGSTYAFFTYSPITASIKCPVACGASDRVCQ